MSPIWPCSVRSSITSATSTTLAWGRPLSRGPYRVPFLGLGASLQENAMKKTEGASKINGPCGYWKHLRPFAKRVANKAARKFAKKQLANYR